MKTYQPELIFYNGAKLTEAPFWDDESGKLYFAAIRYNTVFVYDPAALTVQSIITPGVVGGAVVHGGRLWTFEKSGIYSSARDGSDRRLFAHIITNPHMRYNHGIFDSHGRLLVDVMGDEERCPGMGGLYSVEPDGSSVCLVGGATVPNGIAFSPDESLLYFTDTVTQQVMQYKYNADNGKVSCGQVILDFRGTPSKPDGIFCDDEGGLWVTEWAGGRVCRWSGDGRQKLAQADLPSPHVTACCAGDGCLYITTAKDDPGEPYPSGGLFRIRL
jgi:sugar lactone lactonase YvrE